MLAAAALIGIVGASYWSVAAVAVVSGLLAALAGIGWPHLLDVPAKKTQGAVLALAGAGACTAAYFAPAAALLTWLPGIAAAGVGAIFLVQLLRGTGQAHRLESTIGNIAGVLLMVRPALPSAPEDPPVRAGAVPAGDPPRRAPAEAVRQPAP